MFTLLPIGAKAVPELDPKKDSRTEIFRAVWCVAGVRTVTRCGKFVASEGHSFDTRREAAELSGTTNPDHGADTQFFFFFLLSLTLRDRPPLFACYIFLLQFV